MAKEHKRFQPDYMTDEQIDEYYNAFDWDSMTAIDAKRIMDSRCAHYNSSRQKNRLLYDWLMLKISGLPMWKKKAEIC
jgi:hypothetical protein